MKHSIKADRGAFAIEAVLGLSIFLLSIMAIMCMSLIVRVQANIQYAVDQTAKELSSYYYLLDAVGIADITGSSTAGANTDDVNKLIGNVFDFSKVASDQAGAVGEAAENQDYVDMVSSIDFDSLSDSGEELWDSLKTCADNPMDQVKAVVSVFLRTFTKKALTQKVAPSLCRLLIPKYISGDMEKTDKYLKSVGIENGFDDLKFNNSSLLDDGRTINVVVVYKLNTKKLTFGLLDYDMYFKQSAATAAWVTPNGDDGDGTLKSLEKAYAERGGE